MLSRSSCARTNRSARQSLDTRRRCLPCVSPYTGKDSSLRHPAVIQRATARVDKFRFIGAPWRRSPPWTRTRRSRPRTHRGSYERCKPSRASKRESARSAHPDYGAHGTVTRRFPRFGDMEKASARPPSCARTFSTGPHARAEAQHGRSRTRLRQKLRSGVRRRRALVHKALAKTLNEAPRPRHRHANG